jgi:DNA-binding response OmpR family regulator
LNLRDINTSQTAVTLILNASPNSALLNHRAKMLNNAGYYTSSAHTPEEAMQLAVTMNCDVALICYSFASSERKALSERLQKLSPATTIVCLEPELDNNQAVLVSRIQQALTRLIA